MQLYNPVSDITGIGPRYKLLLEKLEVSTIEDLLMHVPYRYDDFTYTCKIAELISTKPATVIGKISRINNIFTKNGKRLTKAILEDKTEKLDILWFNQHYITQSISINDEIAVSGVLDPSQKKPQFISPQWEKLKDGELTHTAGLVPVYHTTEGVTSKWIRQKVKNIIHDIEIPESLPKLILENNKLQPRNTSLQNIHFPETHAQISPAHYRLAFEELIQLHLRGLKLRDDWNKKENGHKITSSKKDIRDFTKSLPFKLTKAQTRSIDEILKDLGRKFPMNRLLQGDVGSGKTVVAAAALLASIKSGYNTLYMAPTQILAQQHYETLQNLFNQHKIPIQLLTGNSKQETPNNSPYIIIGTHAILHNLHQYNNIGLIVIDEQHKFGVEQRTEIIDYYTQQEYELNDEDITPNLLTMTATPIPRSLALTFYGDLDLSVIDEMPVGRKPVKTWVTRESKRKSAYKWINEQIETTGCQVFVVCPFIEESQYEELQNVRAAETEYKEIVKHFSKRKVALLHGRMKPIEKDDVISKFAKGEYDILVSTPVIEVGIDIPNANIILIETPERFGLASLHQLRGRVGRGENQAYCILMPSTQTSHSITRLKHLEKTHNGNKLAEFDMKIRGPGNIYGTNQHGFLNLKVADITDVEMIKKTKTVSLELFQNQAKYPTIQAYLDHITYLEKN